MIHIIYLIIFICVIGLIITGIFTLIGNIKLFKDIKKQEPTFKHICSSYDDYFTKQQKFPFILLFGKYKDLKDEKLKKRCRRQQILFAAYISFFVIAFGCIFVIANLKHSL